MSASGCWRRFRRCRASVKTRRSALSAFALRWQLAVRLDLPSHAPYRNFVCGVELERLKKVRRFATAEPRRQSVWSETDKILLGSCRANYHVVDATIRQYLTRSRNWRQHQLQHRDVTVVVAVVWGCKNGVIGVDKYSRTEIDRCHHTSPRKPCHGSDIG